MGVEADVMCGAPYGPRSPEPDHDAIVDWSALCRCVVGTLRLTREHAMSRQHPGLRSGSLLKVVAVF
jgi:hypothetical protein